jgi:photosystem II stability/assembly factor-like uncharacterized protein
MKNAVRMLLMSIVAAVVLQAQALQKIDNVCSAEDVDSFGLTCSAEEPCPVYLELSSVDGFGANIFVTGNLHTLGTTLFGLLLASEDGGKTWSEPAKRIRSATLEQVQFADPQHGWVAGGLLDPLPRGPFLLSTVDGGQMWQQTELFDEPVFGSIQQFWFGSANQGQLVVDRSQGKTEKYELYESSDGGETWALKQASGQRLRPARARAPENANWRVLADSAAVKDPSYRVERRAAAGWETLARFAVHAGDCK